MTKGSLIVLGTTSGAGKTTLVTALCRWLSRNGVSVAPFKAQNMSLNSFVTRRGEEIGRAQATQAQAAGIEAEALMNPVLLKPGTDTRSQLIVMGHPIGECDAGKDWTAKGNLLDLVVDAYRQLQDRFDVVICEGAGSPAEINLRESDIVNLGFARAANVPAILIGDIDPGGVFASFVGSLALLAPEDQDLVHGFVVNKFRGDVSLLIPGLSMLAKITGRPTYGVLPRIGGIGIDTEDGLDLETYGDPIPPLGKDILRIAVVRFPRASNLTDFDAFAGEPGVVVRFITRPEEMTDVDLVILPGTRSTVFDLQWLSSQGLGDALRQRVNAGLPTLGICGGFQMMGSQIEDFVESKKGVVDGLGLLPVRTVFRKEKFLASSKRVLGDGTTVTGYEIHHGRVSLEGGTPFFSDQGCRLGPVVGTTWHGLFECDPFRRTYLSEVASATHRDFRPSPDFSFAEWRNLRIELLANLVDDHLEVNEILSVLNRQSKRPPRIALSLGTS